MVKIIESQQQVRDCALAASGVAHQSNFLSCFNSKVEISQYLLLPPWIFKSNVLNFNFPMRNFLNLASLLSNITG